MYMTINIYKFDLVNCVLLKALLPVCMKYTTLGQSQVVNWYKAKLSAIVVTRLSPRAPISQE